jgi:hypothetical protein
MTTPERAQLFQRQRLVCGERLSIQAMLARQAVSIWARWAAGSASHLSLRIRKSITAEGCCQPGM